MTDAGSPRWTRRSRREEKVWYASEPSTRRLEGSSLGASVISATSLGITSGLPVASRCAKDDAAPPAVPTRRRRPPPEDRASHRERPRAASRSRRRGGGALGHPPQPGGARPGARDPQARALLQRRQRAHLRGGAGALSLGDADRHRLGGLLPQGSRAARADRRADLPGPARRRHARGGARGRARPGRVREVEAPRGHRHLPAGRRRGLRRRGRGARVHRRRRAGHLPARPHRPAAPASSP